MAESRMNNFVGADSNEYVRMQDEIDEKRDEFITKYLRRKWPSRLTIVLGILQLIICLVIVAVDLPIILMYAPRWEVLVAGWTLVFTLLSAIGTFQTGNKQKTR